MNNHPTQYEDINQILVPITQGILNILQKDVVGIYVFGSLTYGDFHTETSDIDICVIVQNDVTEIQFEKLKTFHQYIEKQFPMWKKRVEISYTPKYMLSNVLPPGSRPYFGESTFYFKAPYGNEWIINNWILYHHGVALVGPSFQKIAQPIQIQDVQEACVRDLFTEWEPKKKQQEWFDNSHYQSYFVLNLCRILNTVMNATVLSKTKSAEWAKKQYPQWSELIQIAEEWTFGKEMNKKKEAIQFLEFVIGEVTKR